MTFGARARIRLSTFQHNLRIIKSKAPGTRVMAVIKANAYGHGMLQVAKALNTVDCFAVARVAEARALRSEEITTPIAVLGGALAPDDIVEAASLDVQLAVHDEQQLQWIEAGNEPFPVVWLKIDTGMNRLGIRPEMAADAIRRLRASVTDLRLMTHFSSADDVDSTATTDQLARFLPLVGGFDGDISVANSPGLFGWADSLEQLAQVRDNGRLWIRPGLALYGLSPFKGKCGADLGLKPAMQFESTLMSVKKLRAGDCVGYGGTWESVVDTTLGVIAAGYGDGYTRYLPTGTPVLVNRRRVPVIGRVSMDLTAVDLGPNASDKVGDPVILWGDDLPVEEIAERADTIPYQLVTGVTHRELPVYED